MRRWECLLWRFQGYHNSSEGFKKSYNFFHIASVHYVPLWMISHTCSAVKVDLACLIQAERKKSICMFHSLINNNKVWQSSQWSDSDMETVMKYWVACPDLFPVLEPTKLVCDLHTYYWGFCRTCSSILFIYVNKMSYYSCFFYENYTGLELLIFLFGCFNDLSISGDFVFEKWITYKWSLSSIQSRDHSTHSKDGLWHLVAIWRNAISVMDSMTQTMDCSVSICL